MAGLFGNFDMSTGDPLGDLGLIGGLLTARQGQNAIGPLMMQAAAMKMNQQKMERENRANDLQQLSGTYSLLKQQEFMRWAQAAKAGQPYVPNPALGQIEQRMTQLLSAQNLSGGHKATGAGVDMGGMPAPQQPPSPVFNAGQQPAMGAQQPPQGMPAQSQQQAPQNMGGIGGPAGGVPMEAWLNALDPASQKYLEQLAKDKAPQNVRPGGTVAQMGPNGKFEAVFYAPQIGPGMQPTRGENGQVASVDLIPGYLQGQAAVNAAVSGGKAAGALPFEKPSVVNTPGAPTLMTPEQQIRAATGRSPLDTQVSPQVQSARNAEQMKILQAELQNASPQDAAQIKTQLAALQRAQGGGQPFSYSSGGAPGLTLQDNTAQAAQTELGQGIGKEASTVFTNGAASVQGKRLLAGMTDMAKSFDPSKTQPMRSQLAQWGVGMGLDENSVNKILNTNTGDIQGITSAAIQMAGKLTRQTDAQPSQLQFLKTLESMPMAERTPQGFARITDYLNSMHDYNIDKMVALQQYLGQNKGDPSGFEADWAVKSRDLPFVWNNPPAGAQGKPPQNLQRNQTAIYRAQQAVKAGKDPAAVRQRLIEQGFDPSGL